MGKHLVVAYMLIKIQSKFMCLKPWFFILLLFLFLVLFTLLFEMRILSKLRTSAALVVFVVVCSVILLAVNVYELHWMQIEHLRYHHNERTEKQEISTIRNSNGAPVYLAFGKDVSFLLLTGLSIVLHFNPK